LAKTGWKSANERTLDYAFSKSYLSANHDVPVCEDVSYRVETIHAGGTLSIEPDPGQVMICSVASGKVRVQVGAEPEFIMGAHGMFKLKAGIKGTIQNWMYVDAVLHITRLSGFA
jgi:hypothetical protein